MPGDNAQAGYRSIFFEPDWAHQKYFGWLEEFAGDGIRVLCKFAGPVTRRLILVRDAGHAQLESVVARIKPSVSPSEIIVHDFDAYEAAERHLAGLRFAPLGASERLLNIATIVVDLDTPGKELLAGMSTDYRRKIRKAAASGVVVEAHRNPALEILDTFVSAGRNLAAEKKIGFAGAETLTRMYEGGNAILFVSRSGGQIGNFLHVYIAGSNAIFMTGVNPVKENNGAGQYIHWRAMQHLKQLGLRWYDLGGVRSLDPGDGIYNFKRGFGGVAMKLGSESGYRSFSLAAALRIRSYIRGKSLD